MAKGASKSNPPRPRKRVEAADVASTLKRARDGSAFTRCEACKKDVPVVLIDMHSCSLDNKIKMSLEAQVVEKVVEAKKPAERKRTASTSDTKERKVKKEKKSKDPNKPKRPPTAFFLFMDDFRKSFKEANPENKNVALVSKGGGERWKSMTDEEKKLYIERAAELRAEYQKAVKENDEENEEHEGSGKEEEKEEEVQIEEKEEEDQIEEETNEED